MRATGPPNNHQDDIQKHDAKHYPLVYFARAMDGLSKRSIIKLAQSVRIELAQKSLAMVDPFLETIGGSRDANSGRIVCCDLILLRKSDAVLMDMSIPARNYVGCTCELVYAFNWRIPVVVYVGNSSNGSRHWLKYHATEICRSRSDAIERLVKLLHIVNNDFGQV